MEEGVVEQSTATGRRNQPVDILDLEAGAMDDLASLDGITTEVQPTLDPEELTRELDDLLSKWDTEEAPSQEHMDQYIDRFEKQLADELVTIGGATLEQIQEEERNLQKIELETRQERANLEKSVAEQELRREREAQLRLQYEIRRRKQEIDRKKQLFLLQRRIQREKMRQAMRKSESHLKWALAVRKGDVTKEYGTLAPQTGTVKGAVAAIPKWSVEWKHTPQPVELNIVAVRGVKDKLPPGKYVIVTSVYDHMAGHALRWSAWENRRKTGQATLPAGHDGMYNRAELRFDQKLYCALPAKEDMRPAMVFTFELFMLRGDLSPFDRVVAWGAFPICNEHFDIVQGKCKLPMLRGPMRQNIDRFSKIQALMHKDLDNWLANLYFDVRLLPKFTAGQKEIRVQTKFKQSTIAILDRVRQYARPKRYEALTGSENDTASLIEDDDDESLGETGPDGREKTFVVRNLDGGEQSSSIPQPEIIADNWWKKMNPHQDNLTDGDTNAIVSPAAAQLTGNTTIATPFVPEILRNQQEEGIHEVYSRRHNFDPDKAYEEQADDLLNAHEDRLGHDLYEAWQEKPKTSSYTERLEQHQMAIRRQETNLGRHSNPLFERTRFVARMFLGELGLLYYSSIEFWWTWIVLICFWFIQIYLHYVGQYFFIVILGHKSAVVDFIFYPYTVELTYQTDQLSLSETTGLVLMGPLFVILVYAVCMFFFWLAQKVFMGLPFVVSKVMLAFGIWSVLNPAAILVVDAIMGRFDCDNGEMIGDAFKLYCYLETTTSNGGLGIPITILVYLATITLSMTLLYVYLLLLHNNGRMLDCWWRLTSKERTFLIPYDLEISQQQLAYLVNKAEQWRGPDGQRRKCTIYDYVIEADEVLRRNEQATKNQQPSNQALAPPPEQRLDEEENQSQIVETGQKELTTHTAIFTLHLDGLRELYRQFLRLPDGSVVEIFGDIATAMLGSPDLKSALIKKQRQMEDDLDEEIEKIEKSKAGFFSRLRGKGSTVTQEEEEINMDEIPEVSTSRQGTQNSLRRRKPEQLTPVAEEEGESGHTTSMV